MKASRMRTCPGSRCARLPVGALAQAPKPQYGGELNIGNVFVTVNPMSPDTGDWAWKHDQDTGLVYEQLFAADLSKSIRNGGKYSFTADAWIAARRAARRAGREVGDEAEPAARRSAAAQGRDVPGQGRRDGVARADRRRRGLQLRPAEQEPEEDPRLLRPHRARSRPPASTRVTFFMKAYNAEWDYRFGWGYYCAIVPKEVVAAGPGNWKNVNGTGPFQLQRLRAGQLAGLHQEPGLLGQGEDRRRRVQAALRRQDHLPHHQGRGHLHHRAAHRQARHAGDGALEPCRRAEEERAQDPVEPAGWPTAACSSRCAWTRSPSTTSACAAR